MKTIHNTRYQALLQLLLEAREAAGLTQKELATRLDRPQSFISKTENAERRLDVIEFLEVCKGIGVDPYEVLRGLDATISTLNAPLPPNTAPASPSPDKVQDQTA